eukprot:8884230-Alexandrium_andersonii.AAC.3
MLIRWFCPVVAGTNHASAFLGDPLPPRNARCACTLDFRGCPVGGFGQHRTYADKRAKGAANACSSLQ